MPAAFASTWTGKPRQALVQFAQGAQGRQTRVGVGARAVYDVLGFRVRPAGKRNEGRNAQIGRHVEHPHLPFAASVIVRGRSEEFVVKAGEIHPGDAQPVIPPDGESIALDQFIETLQDGLLQGVPRCAAVGIGDQVGGAALFRRHAVEHRRRQVSMPALRERPHGRPVDFGGGVETGRDNVVGVAGRVDAFRVVELVVAEKLHFVGVDRPVFRGEIVETAAGTDFVSAPGAGMTFDRLAEGAGLGLFPRTALARALAAQAAPERTQAPASHAGIAPGPVDVKPVIVLTGRARQPGDDSADRAHQVAISRQGGFRRHGPRAAAVTMEFGAGRQTDRHRRPIGPVQRFVAADRTLRPAQDRMLRARKCSDV